MQRRMAPRKRFGVPTEADAKIGARLRQVRVESGLPRRELASHIGLTVDQIRRVENGIVSLRFRPGWRFCAFTRTNPLWLAFGDTYARLGFAPLAQKTVPIRDTDRFQSVMADWADKYRAGRRRSLPAHRRQPIGERRRRKSTKETKRPL
jgi:transcriptional regulator with XRE-family HTH domain